MHSFKIIVPLSTRTRKMTTRGAEDGTCRNKSQLWIANRWPHRRGSRDTTRPSSFGHFNHSINQSCNVPSTFNGSLTAHRPQDGQQRSSSAATASSSGGKNDAFELENRSAAADRFHFRKNVPLRPYIKGQCKDNIYGFDNYIHHIHPTWF